MAEPAIKFDTAAAVEQLIEAGIPREHAAAQVRLLADTINDNFATKADIERLELKLDTRIAEVRSEIADFRAEVHTGTATLRSEIADLRAEVHTGTAALRSEIADLRAELHTGTAALRSEIADLRAELHTDIAAVRTEVANLETRLTGKIGELDVRLQTTLKWTAGMQVGTILAIIAAVKLI